MARKWCLSRGRSLKVRLAWNHESRRGCHVESLRMSDLRMEKTTVGQVSRLSSINRQEEKTRKLSTKAKFI